MAELVEQICSATDFLTTECGHTLPMLTDITGLHKNSLMRIKDLRLDKGRTGGNRWRWNPQISSFAALEKLVETAECRGWTPEWQPRRSRGVRKRDRLTRAAEGTETGAPETDVSRPGSGLFSSGD